MSYGWITEGFSILPSLNINWMHISESYDSKKIKKIYDIQFAWLWWYVSTNRISKQLKKLGY